MFRFDSQPVCGVENVYFGLLLDVVVDLKHHISELFAARVVELTLYVRSGEACCNLIGIPPFLEVHPTLCCNAFAFLAAETGVGGGAASCSAVLCIASSCMEYSTGFFVCRVFTVRRCASYFNVGHCDVLRRCDC